jgi:hypothetical protein
MGERRRVFRTRNAAKAEMLEEVCRSALYWALVSRPCTDRNGDRNASRRWRLNEDRGFK